MQELGLHNPSNGVAADGFTDVARVNNNFSETELYEEANRNREADLTADGALRAVVTMRSLFALTGMGFLRDRDGHAVTESSPVEDIDAAEPVRIRLSAAWIRVDARYGSVYQRRHRDLSVTVL